MLVISGNQLHIDNEPVGDLGGLHVECPPGTDLMEVRAVLKSPAVILYGIGPADSELKKWGWQVHVQDDGDYRD